MNSGDTITAISTATAPAVRMIIRLSGPQSLTIARKLTRSQSLEPSSAQQTLISFDNLRCAGWVYAFHSPHSYTGEDSVEFHLPGSPVLAKLLLDELYRQDARPAEPGEFTARAFFNGKIGLTEAEGVAATIAAGNQAELLAARQLLAGELVRRLTPITELIAQTLALIEVGIDFSEEDVTFLAIEEVRERIKNISNALNDLLTQSGRFEQLTHEPHIVLAGRPNAGKSSLINALCGRHRAIVSDISGTTRDVLTAELFLKNGRVLISDVAGLDATSAGGDTQTIINQQMQTKARQAIESADHVVLVKDSTDDRDALVLPREINLVVLTKSDLKQQAPHIHPAQRVSSLTGHGMNDLLQALDALAFGDASRSSTLALNRRHLSAIGDALAALSRAAQRTTDGAAELVAMDLRDALDSLGSIVGQVTPDDVLGRVFSAFCIGK